MQAQQAQATATLQAKAHDGADEKNRSHYSSHLLTPGYSFPPPVSQPPLLKSPSSYASSINPVSTPTEAKSGGLSAQDLSFFEGL